jgi:hypothetical protein
VFEKDRERNGNNVAGADRLQKLKSDVMTRVSSGAAVRPHRRTEHRPCNDDQAQ